MRPTPAIGLAAIVVAACAHQGPAVRTDMSWSLNTVEGEGLKLVLGQPRTDDVLLMMTCQPRSGAVRVSLNTTAGAPPTLEVASGGRKARYAAEIGPNLGGGAVVEAVAKAADPVLARFAATGDLAVANGARRARLPAGGEDARRFIQGCRA